MSDMCTGFSMSILVPDVSFCTIRFLHYIVQNIIPITTVRQTISLLVFRITPQNHLFLTYVQIINYKLPIIFRRYFDEYVQTGRSDHSKRKDYRKREFIGKRQLHDGSAAKIYGIASADGYEEV